MGLYTAADDPADLVRRVNSAATGSPYVDRINSASARAPFEAPLQSTPPSPTATPATASAVKPGIISQYATEAKDLGAGARQLANGQLSTGTGLLAKGANFIGGLAAKAGGLAAAGSAIIDSRASDSTDRYAQRFGVAAPTGDGSIGDIAKFTALRAGGFASDLGNNLTGGLIGKLAFRDSATPVTNAANVAPISSAQTQPVAPTTTAADTALPAVKSDFTSVPGITRQTGGVFGSAPTFTDDPTRAAQERAAPQSNSAPGSNFITGQSDAGKFLNAAFQGHIASGDLERARATLNPYNADQQAALGAAEDAQVQARNQAYRTAPQERMLQDYIQSKIDAEKKGPGIAVHAFQPGLGYVRSRDALNAQAKGQSGVDPGIIAGLQASIAASKGQLTDPVAALAASKAQDLNAKSVNTDIAGKQISQKNLLQVGALQQSLINEQDPAKRERIKEDIQVLTGKYEKTAASPKAVLEDFDTGQKDMLGQPIYKKRAINQETGEPITKPAAAPKVDMAALKSEAQAKLKAMGGTDAAKAYVNDFIKQKFGVEGAL